MWVGVQRPGMVHFERVLRLFALSTVSLSDIFFSIVYPGLLSVLPVLTKCPEFLAFITDIDCTLGLYRRVLSVRRYIRNLKIERDIKMR